MKTAFYFDQAHLSHFGWAKVNMQMFSVTKGAAANACCKNITVNYSENILNIVLSCVTVFLSPPLTEQTHTEVRDHLFRASWTDEADIRGHIWPDREQAGWGTAACCRASGRWQMTHSSHRGHRRSQEEWRFRKGSAAAGGARHFLTGLYECRNTLTLVQQSSRDVWGEHQVWSQANESNYFWESYIFIRSHNRPSNRSKCRFIFNQRTIAFIMRDIKGEN